MIGYACDRRTVLASFGASTLAAVPRRAHFADPTQTWLARHVISVRTVDAADDDFSDLEPLAAAIGHARVVQLGEPSHNAGTCFAAKVRLVRFLHQRLGFDVMAWEAGIYDVLQVDAALRAGEDPVAAAKRGLLQNWAASAECRPLFAYAQQSRATHRPLVMAGFDSTLTSPFANFAADLRTFVSTARESGLRRRASELAEDLIESFGAITAYVERLNKMNADLAGMSPDDRKAAMERWENQAGAALRPTRPMLDRFERARGQFVELLRTDEGKFAATGSIGRKGFIRRVVYSLGARAANLHQRFGNDVPASSDGGLAEQNRRDAANAENLRWLIDQGYPGRKLIVWAHNAHVMNAYYEAPDWQKVRLDPAANAMKPSGVYLAERLGTDLYTVGFTAYDGQDGWKGLYATPIVPAPIDSIEERLHRLAKPYAFVNLRAARHAGNPLRRTQLMRVPKYEEVSLANPTQPYDGLFFIDRMEQATLIPV